MKERSLKKELSYLWSMELLDAFVFWIMYLILTEKEMRFSFSNAIVSYPLLILCFILVEGSFYWFNCLRRVNKKKSLPATSIGRMYQLLKLVNYVLIAAYIPILFLTYRGDLVQGIIGVLIWLFAIIEFVNYFYYRLSYYTKSGLGLQIVKPFKQMLSGTLVKSQVAKEISLCRQKSKKL